MPSFFISKILLLFTLSLSSAFEFILLKFSKLNHNNFLSFTLFTFNESTRERKINPFERILCARLTNHFSYHQLTRPRSAFIPRWLSRLEPIQFTSKAIAVFFLLFKLIIVSAYYGDGRRRRQFNDIIKERKVLLKKKWERERKKTTKKLENMKEVLNEKRNVPSCNYIK